MNEQDQAIINQLIITILSDWNKKNQEFPNILYHYTSSSGLIGILQHREIWLTNVFFMNDASELDYGKQLLKKVLSNKLDDAHLSILQKEWLKDINSSINYNSILSYLSVFAACFCEDGNILSQWRAYRGVGGGYAIGIDFFHSFPFFDKKIFIRKVIYDIKEQEEILNIVINTFLSTLEQFEKEKESEYIKKEVWTPLNQRFSAIMSEYFTCFKHPDFYQEREWRLIYLNSFDPLYNRDILNAPKFRSYEGNVIPYHTLNFNNWIEKSKDDLYGIAFPFKEIVIGPTIASELNKRSVNLLLCSIHPDHVTEIKVSEIPLRWL